MRNNFIRIARANISALRRTTPASATVKWEINWRQLYELARARDRHYYYRYTRSFAPCHVTLSINRVTNLLILLFLFPSEYCCSFCSSNLHLLPLSLFPSTLKSCIRNGFCRRRLHWRVFFLLATNALMCIIAFSFILTHRQHPPLFIVTYSFTCAPLFPSLI